MKKSTFTFDSICFNPRNLKKTQRHILTQTMYLFEALSHCGNFHEGESPYTNGVMATPETLGR